MARDGSGTMSIPNSDFVSGSTISSSQVDANFATIVSELTNSIAADGQTTPSANLKMGGFKHTGLGSGSAATDSANLGQIQAQAYIWCGTAGGTKNALTLTPSPAIMAYAAGQTFKFKSGSTQSDDAATVAVSGLTTKAIQSNGSALSATIYIEADKWYEITYDGAAFQIRKFFLPEGTYQPYDADTLKADTTDTLTAGFNATEYDNSTVTTGTLTPDPANGNFQKYVNNGAHTLAPPGSTCTIVLQCTNDSSAGAITTSGFTVVRGDALTTTNGHDFFFFITRNNGFSSLTVQALQ